MFLVTEDPYRDLTLIEPRIVSISELFEFGSATSTLLISDNNKYANFAVASGILVSYSLVVFN